MSPDPQKEIQRYEPEHNERRGQEFALGNDPIVMEPYADGEWVKHSDHLELLAAADREYDEATQELATELAEARSEANEAEAERDAHALALSRSLDLEQELHALRRGLWGEVERLKDWRNEPAETRRIDAVYLRLEALLHPQHCQKHGATDCEDCFVEALAPQQDSELPVVEDDGTRTHCLDCGKPKTESGVPAICATWHQPEETCTRCGGSGRIREEYSTGLHAVTNNYPCPECNQEKGQPPSPLEKALQELERMGREARAEADQASTELIAAKETGLAMAFEVAVAEIRLACNRGGGEDG